MKQPSFSMPAPHNAEVERCALGAMLIDPRATEVAVELLQEDDFHLPRHRFMFRAIRTVFEKEQAIDEILLVSHLQTQNQLESAGGKEMIGEIMMATPSAGNVENYCSILREITEDRMLYLFAMELAGGIERKQATKELLVRMQEVLDAIHQRRANITSDPADLHDLAVPIAREALELPPRELWGMPCGLANGAIDRLVGGFSRRHYIVLAARTSMGKSTFVTAVSRGVRKCNPNEGIPLILSTEMAEEAMARQSLASAANVHTRALLMRNLGPLQKEAVSNVMRRKTLSGVHVKYLTTPTISQIRVIAKRHQRKHGLPLLVVDLAAKTDAGGENATAKLANISAALAALKGELDCCVIACVQLNRSLFMSDDRRPELHHLKGSGSWEEDADKVIFLHRPSYFGTGDKGDLSTEVIQAKDRDFGDVRSTFIEYRKNTGEYISREKKES